jgi:hypothetical protein
MDDGFRWFALVAYVATGAGLLLLASAVAAMRWAAAIEQQVFSRLQTQHPVQSLALVQATDGRPGGYYSLRDWAKWGGDTFEDAELAGQLTRLRRARTLAASLGGPGALLFFFGLSAVIFL